MQDNMKGTEDAEKQKEGKERRSERGKEGRGEGGREAC